jgi:hypothetical protein
MGITGPTGELLTASAEQKLLPNVLNWLETP